MVSEKGNDVFGTQKNLAFGSNIWDALTVKEAAGGEPRREKIAVIMWGQTELLGMKRKGHDQRDIAKRDVWR